MLTPLSAVRLRNAGAGREVLRLRSAWKTSDTNYLLARLDLDRVKRGHDDIEAAKTWTDKQLAGKVASYWTDTDGGKSGYVWLVIPTGVDELTGEEKPIMSRRHANKVVLDFHFALRALARRAGIHTGVECKGGYLVTSQERDENGVPTGPKRVSLGTLDGQYMATAPVVATLEDVQHLERAELRIDHPIIADIIRRGREAADALEAEARAAKERLEKLLAACDELEEDGPAPSPTPARKAKGAAGPTEKNNKQATRSSCVAAAVRKLGIRSREELLGRREEILATAGRMYIDHGFGDAVIDEKRRRDFHRAFEYVSKTFNPAKIGKRKDAAPAGPSKYRHAWFTDDGAKNDVKAIRHKIASIIPGRVIQAAADDLVRRGQPAIDPDVLAVVAWTLSKNQTINEDGELRQDDGPAPSPVRAALKMCNHPRFGLGVSGSTIKAALILICQYRIHATDNTYGPGRCQRWVCLRPHWFRHHKDYAAAVARRADMKRLRDSAPATMETGAGGHAHAFSSPLRSGYCDASTVEVDLHDPEAGWVEVGDAVFEVEIEDTEPSWTFHQGGTAPVVHFRSDKMQNEYGWPMASTELESDPFTIIAQREAATVAVAMDEAARDRVEAAALVAAMVAGESNYTNEVF
jgi:hypothetical protein